MKRYFCLCLGGIKSDSDASVSVESFYEIKLIIDDCLKDPRKKFISYETQHILDKSPDRFPHWGKTYMVVGIEPSGGRIPLGYCNFAKTKRNSLSGINISVWALILIAITMSILSAIKGNLPSSLWALNCALLSFSLLKLRRSLIYQKLLYLLK